MIDSRRAADLDASVQAMASARRVLVITGAGVSAESGIPTYRGPDGAYDKNPALRDVMSEAGFLEDPTATWRHIDEMRCRAAEALPNAAHRILAKWEAEQRFDSLLIATQNVDGLHQKAGSKRVSELHGSLWQMAEPRDVDFTDDDEFSNEVRFMDHPDMRDEILQGWSEENHRRIWEDRRVPFPEIPPYEDSKIRPNILLFDESYGSRLLWVEDFINRTPDLVLVIGCSGAVNILDVLLRRCRDRNPGCGIIHINPFENCLEICHWHLPTLATIAMGILDDPSKELVGYIKPTANMLPREGVNQS